jgi:cytochrome oxidase assembly protein ShyY1
MDIPTERPADADETQTSSEIAINITACVLVALVVFLRYLGRWALKRRMDTGKGKQERVYGLDDSE